MTPPYKFYVQRFSPNGVPVTANAIDITERWGVACQEFPYNIYGDIKDFPKRDWKDEHGVSIFIPSDGQKLKDFDIKVKFLAKAEAKTVGQSTKTAEQVLRENLRSFMDYLYGLSVNGSVITGVGSSLAIYDEYNGVGFGMVTINNLSNSNIDISNNLIECIGQFTITFHVNDPVPFVKGNEQYLPWRGYNSSSSSSSE